jgi:phage/plasmid-like protein (TIGR03299 family)
MPANVQSIFYVGDMPWHREGVGLKEPPDSETAIRCAGLNWRVSKVRLFTEFGDHPVPNCFGVMRSDNYEILGVVGNDYTPLQNSDAFRFFDPLIDGKFLEYETAGALGAGEIVWVLAKVKRSPSFFINGRDEIEKYLLLSNSHDGSSAVGIKFTPIRVVCQNTLNLALSHGETTRIQHLTGMFKKLDDVRVVAEDICRIYSNAEDLFRKMAKKDFPEEQARAYFADLFPVPDESQIKTDDQHRKRESILNIRNGLMEFFHYGCGVREFGVGNTLWAAYNAVTQYVDHPVNYRLGNNRLVKRIWFGDGEKIKVRAYKKAGLLLA